MASNSALIHLNDVVVIMVGCAALCVAFFGLFYTGESAKTLIS